MIGLRLTVGLGGVSDMTQEVGKHRQIKQT